MSKPLCQILSALSVFTTDTCALDMPLTSGETL